MSGRVTFAAILAWYRWCPARKLSGTVEEIREGAGEIYYKSLKYDWYDYFAGPGADRRCGGRVKSDAAAPFDWHMSVKEWVKVQVKEAKRLVRSLPLQEWWSFEFEPHSRVFSSADVAMALALPHPMIPFMWFFPPTCFICGSKRVDSDYARPHAIGHDVCGICRKDGFWFFFDGEV